jgi:hypothetical protein
MFTHQLIFFYAGQKELDLVVMTSPYAAARRPP